jgi:hypothetical protein
VDVVDTMKFSSSYADVMRFVRHKAGLKDKIMTHDREFLVSQKKVDTILSRPRGYVGQIGGWGCSPSCSFPELRSIEWHMAMVAAGAVEVVISVEVVAVGVAEEAVVVTTSGVDVPIAIPTVAKFGVNAPRARSPLRTGIAISLWVVKQ